MKLETAEIDRLTSHLYDRLTSVVEYQIAFNIKEFAKVCESPIEILFGAALHFSFNVAVPVIGRRKLLFLATKERRHERLVPSQWELVAQHPWEQYRIDFALITELPYPIFIECDGHDFHERTKGQAAHDREKDRKIQAAGIPILRFTGSEIYKSPQDCAFQVFKFATDRVDALKPPPGRFSQISKETA